MMIRLCFVQCGIRREIIVPFAEARWANKRLFNEGAAVFWSEHV
jgi:hypothetical protein